jgi:hypothetical protein
MLRRFFHQSRSSLHHKILHLNKDEQQQEEKGD